MRCSSCLSSAIAAGMLLALFAPPTVGQAPTEVPPISARQFVSGSAKVTVTGSFQIDQDVAINSKASVSDGEMTWLQFGNSGSDVPNALITFQGGDFGIIVGAGKSSVTGESPQCAGNVAVTAALVSGNYSCAAVVSFDRSSGKMGKVDIKITFTAKS